jgi:hypothetical protein
MAKAAKPEHALQHAHATPGKRSRESTVAAREGRRGRMATTGENMTELRWKKVISAYANGADRAGAAKYAGIAVPTIDAYLISNIAAYKQIRDAQLTHIRSDWPADLLDAIFTSLASGLSLKRAALANGVDADKMSRLYYLVRKDKAIRAAYDDARELWAESFLDDTIDIADNSKDDRLPGGKINHEVVNRSKLRIDARWRAMGAMVKKRFGDHKHVELEGHIQVNHIALLTGARKRLEGAHDRTKPKPATIDNDTGTVE